MRVARDQRCGCRSSGIGSDAVAASIGSVRVSVRRTGAEDMCHCAERVAGGSRGFGEVAGGEGDGLSDDGGGVAEAWKDVGGVEFGFAAEPGLLALGVVAVALLGGGDGCRFGHLAAQDGRSLGVAKRGEGAALRTEPREQRAGLCDEACGEHGGAASVDAGVQLGARRGKGQAEDRVAGEGVAARGPLLRDGAAGGERDLDGADELGGVVGVDEGGGGGVEADEGSVEADMIAASKRRAEGGVGGRCGEEAVEERAGVEAGAAGEDGEGVEVGEDGAGLAGVVAGGARFRGVVEVEQVVRDEGALSGSGPWRCRAACGGRRLPSRRRGSPRRGAGRERLPGAVLPEAVGPRRTIRGFMAALRFGLESPPAGVEELQRPGAEKEEEQDGEGEEEEAAELGAAFSLEGLSSFEFALANSFVIGEEVHGSRVTPGSRDELRGTWDTRSSWLPWEPCRGVAGSGQLRPALDPPCGRRRRGGRRPRVFRR